MGKTKSDWCNAYGFSLSEVTWGYRDTFRNYLNRLRRDGFIGGSHREEFTQNFFSFCNKLRTSVHEEACSSFLHAACSSFSWVLRSPVLFRWWAEAGQDIAEQRLYVGLQFFNISAEGGLGRTPAELDTALRIIEDLIDDYFPLISGFINYYSHLSTMLSQKRIALFVDEAKKVFENSHDAGADFIRGDLASSDAYIRRLTSEVRLDDIEQRMRYVIAGISGKRVDIDSISMLDSDELMQRGSSIVTSPEYMYVPSRVYDLGSYERHRDYYRMSAIVCGTEYSIDGFSIIHGKPGFSDLNGLFGDRPSIVDSAVECSLLQLCEYARVLAYIRNAFPGAENLCKRVIVSEFSHRGKGSEAERTLQYVIGSVLGIPISEQNKGREECRRLINTIITKSSSAWETAQNVTSELKAHPEAASVIPSYIHPLSCMPDHLFTLTLSPPPRENTIHDLSLKDSSSSSPEKQGIEEEGERDTADIDGGGDAVPEEDEAEEGNAVDAAYIYDEYNGLQNSYYKNWCLVRERIHRIQRGYAYDRDHSEMTDRIRAAFERIKPDTARIEKYLYNGDSINIDRVISYICQKRAKIRGKQNFYEKGRIITRDAAVLLLIDISGSTGEHVHEDENVLDLEKRAAALCAEGLEMIGDTFGVFGFTGNGRENCEYVIIKDFDEEWGSTQRDRLSSITPGSSTRLGAALRHSGYKMERLRARRKIILVITDGKPMDSGYEPATGYAYSDVKQACRENIDRGITTFGIITSPDEKDVLPRMFIQDHFLICNTIRELPLKLSSFFIKICS